MRIILALPLVLLTACAHDYGKVAVSPDLPDAPASLLRPCTRPASLPDRELSQEETEGSWKTDRRSLATCRDRHAALRAYYLDRDSRLRGD